MRLKLNLKTFKSKTALDLDVSIINVSFPLHFCSPVISKTCSSLFKKRKNHAS